jgi:ribosome-associated protein
MLQITEAIQLDESEIHFKFIRSPGPGGQHVNKAATAVQLRFDVLHSTGLPDRVRRRLMSLARNRITTRGILTITANRFRSQDLNRKDALARLANLIVRSSHEIKPRRRTKPTIASRKRQEENKMRRSKLKRTRRPVAWSGE